jgi:hypothetical protein
LPGKNEGKIMRILALEPCCAMTDQAAAFVSGVGLLGPALGAIATYEEPL